MSAAVTFFLALFLLVAFVLFRFSEEHRGSKVWAHSREGLDDVVSDLYRGAVLGDIPGRYKAALTHFFHTLLHDTVVFAVEGLRAIDRPLARLSNRLRRTAPQGTGKGPSEFLKTITPEKPVAGTVEGTDSV